MIDPCLCHKTNSMNLPRRNICGIKQYLRPSTMAWCTTPHSLNSATGPHEEPCSPGYIHYSLKLASLENFSLVTSWIFIKQNDVNFFNIVLFDCKRGPDQIKSIAKKPNNCLMNFDQRYVLGFVWILLHIDRWPELIALYFQKSELQSVCKGNYPRGFFSSPTAAADLHTTSY